jgi:hypothetical protein
MSVHDVMALKCVYDVVALNTYPPKNFIHKEEAHPVGVGGCDLGQE